MQVEVNLRSRMRSNRKWLAIGQIAKRAGVNASALRFYEQKGLIQSLRSEGGRRLYPQDVLRRIAFIRVAQGMGLSLDEIAAALSGLPDGRTPDRGDWGNTGFLGVAANGRASRQGKCWIEGRISADDVNGAASVLKSLHLLP